MKTLLYSYIFILLLASIALTSCEGKKQRAFTYLENLSWEEIIECAKKENKGIILSISSEGCTLCSKFLEDMEDDLDMENIIGAQYIYVRIDQNKKENEWITQTTAISAFPTFLIFNKNINLRGMFCEYKSKALFLSRMNEIANGNIYCKQEKIYNHLVIKEMKRVTDENFLIAIQKNIEAQHCWNQYKKTKNITSLEQCMISLQKSIDLFPDIYNQYLLSAAYMEKGDTVNSKLYAKESLSLATSNVRPLYINLRADIRKIIDPNYDKYDDPYIEFKEQRIILDTLAFGEKKEITFILYNKGRKEMKVDSLELTCDCMELATSFNKNILPGDSTTIQIEMNSDNIGDFIQYLFVLSNAINSPQMLIIKGHVKENYSSE